MDETRLVSPDFTSKPVHSLPDCQAGEVGQCSGR